MYINEGAFMKIEKIGDFKDVIKEINQIYENYQNGVLDIYDKIMHVSEAVMDCSYIDDNTRTSYCQIGVLIADKINSGNSITADDIENWNVMARAALAVAFIQLAVKLQNEGTLLSGGDDELDELLLGCFQGDSLASIAAHYKASQRLARKDPMRCYLNTMNDFRKEPELIKKIYNNIQYVYEPETINDAQYTSCPICGSEDGEPYYCADQAILGNSSFSPAKLWMKCSCCNNLYAYNFPVWNMGEINGHYTKKNEADILMPRNPLYIYCEIFNHIKEYTDGNSYLEVGVGNGEMLAVALEMGFDVSAVEICKDDCENISAALGVDIVWSDFLKFDTEKRFDIIIMGDILEHVSKPIDALQKAYDLLNDNGILWLSTPNYNSAFTRMRKFSDPMWNQKNHFTYFSYEGLKPFLDKVGFDVKRYEVSNRYNGSMELILQKR